MDQRPGNGTGSTRQRLPVALGSKFVHARWQGCTPQTGMSGASEEMR
ncbi:MAG: hypothetical protein VCC02_04845 [Myxococcota bacterium]